MGFVALWRSGFMPTFTPKGSSLPTAGRLEWRKAGVKSGSKDWGPARMPVAFPSSFRVFASPMLTSLPNLLTLSRIGVIPIIIGLFYIPENWAAWLACALFALAGITDYFDGYLARSWAQESVIGRFLDPIADKLLVAATLFMLVAFDRVQGVSVLPAVVILLREVLVSGLREFLAGVDVGLPVSRLAKWKTTIQMVAIGFLIVGDTGPLSVPSAAIGITGLWLAGILTLVTGWDYLEASWKHMAEPAPASVPTRPLAGKLHPPVAP